jgi:sirohydrochlorin cobaltochelatase
MQRILILAMHGTPPRDFPPAEMAEFMRLHAQAEHAPLNPRDADRSVELERRLRAWPRTPDNDPFHAASHELGKALGDAAGAPVIVAFNEFCDPTVEAALAQAVERSPKEVVVVTPMLTPGGEHAAVDIPAAIERTRQAYPDVRFVYAWPIPLESTASFLADHVRRLGGLSST